MKRTKRRMTLCTCASALQSGLYLGQFPAPGGSLRTDQRHAEGAAGRRVHPRRSGSLRRRRPAAESLPTLPSSARWDCCLGGCSGCWGKSGFRRSRWAWPLPASTRPSRPSSPAAAPASGTCALTAAARPPVCSCCFWGMLIGRDDLPEIISGGNET